MTRSAQHSSERLHQCSTVIENNQVRVRKEIRPNPYYGALLKEEIYLLTVDAEDYGILDCSKCKHRLTCMLNPKAKVVYLNNSGALRYYYKWRRSDK